MTQAVWKSPFISLLHLSYEEALRTRARNGLRELDFPNIFFCSAGSFRGTQFATCWCAHVAGKGVIVSLGNGSAVSSIQMLCSSLKYCVREMEQNEPRVQSLV